MQKADNRLRIAECRMRIGEETARIGDYRYFSSSIALRAIWRLSRCSVPLLPFCGIPYSGTRIPLSERNLPSRTSSFGTRMLVPPQRRNGTKSGRSRKAGQVGLWRKRTLNHRCYRNDQGEDFSLVERFSAKPRMLLAGLSALCEIRPAFWRIEDPTRFWWHRRPRRCLWGL